jgi:hypothetical protein
VSDVFGSAAAGFVGSQGVAAIGVAVAAFVGTAGIAALGLRRFAVAARRTQE